MSAPDDPPTPDLPAVPAREPLHGAGLVAGMACPYCGAPLTGGYYFCTRCATPWQALERVLPRARPAPPTVGDLIRTKAPGVWPLFWTQFCVVLGGGIVAWIVLGEEHLVAAILLLDALLLLVTAGFAVTHGGTLRPALTHPGFDRAAGWIAVAAVVPLLALNAGYHGLLRALLDLRDGGLDVFTRAGVSHTAMVWMIAVFPAVSEEIAFRGLLLPWLAVAIDERRALVLSAALFSAMHFSVLSAPYLFVVGLVLGWARLRSRSLYPSIVLHFLHNLGVLEVLGG